MGRVPHGCWGVPVGGRGRGEAEAGAADCQLQWRSSVAGADPICPLPRRIIPLYLIYRPANNIPYATMEEDLGGPCVQYCVTERDGSLVARGTSEVVLKCCTFQHWVYQWTNGNILVTDMEGKETSLPSGSRGPFWPVEGGEGLACPPASFPHAMEPSCQGADPHWVAALCWAEPGCPPFPCRSGLEGDQCADCHQPERVSDLQLLVQGGPGYPQLHSAYVVMGRGGERSQAPSSFPAPAGLCWRKAGAEDGSVGRYQGLKESCFPSLLEQFAVAHQCNHYCSILGLKPLEPAKPKGSKSPSVGRKSAQSSPQLQKKGLASPQGVRKAAVSPKSSRRAAEAGEALAASRPTSGENSRSGCPQ